MKRLLFFVGVGLMLSGCQQGFLLTNIDPVNPDNPEQVSQLGEQLFFRHCEGCHADGGVGSEIAFQTQNPVVDYATFVIRNGRDDGLFAVEMPAYSEDELSDDEMNAIIFFLRQAPKPTDGAGLYARFCANCHGDDARGGVSQENIRGEADEVLEKVREGEGSNIANRTKFMPSYSASELSNAEANLIADFISSL